MNIILMDRRGWGTICTTTDILDSGNVSTDRRDGYTWVNFCCIQYVYSIQYILYTVYSILYVQHICTMYNVQYSILLSATNRNSVGLPVTVRTIEGKIGIALWS